MHRQMIYAVNCLYGNSGYICFWNAVTKDKETIAFNLYTENHHGMIELPDHCIAVSTKDDIVVFDVDKYIVVRKICDNEVIKGAGSICLLNERTFVYANKGCFCQIGVNGDNGDVLFKVITESDFWGWGGVGYDNERKYIIMDNYKGNLVIYVIDYLKLLVPTE